MLPITRVPETIAKGMEKFRKVFCRDEGFEHVSRYLSGLIVSPNKTLQEIYNLQVWLGSQQCRDHIVHRCAFKGPAPRDHFVGRHAEAEDVSAMINVAPSNQLPRHESKHFRSAWTVREADVAFISEDDKQTASMIAKQ